MGRTGPRFIFMLTSSDRTVPDAGARLEEALACGIRHVGFKDVGLPLAELRGLAAAIRAGGGTAYLEVVSLDTDSERRSAEAARELGVDELMGGTRPEVVLPVLAGSGIRYSPFAGRIEGLPSRLTGSIDGIVAEARRLAALEGVTGIDLLAYRFAGDSERLMREVCAAVGKPVTIAGSIDRPERIAAVAAAGAAAFTIGTAALEGRFASAPGLPAQLGAIVASLDRLATG